jgi:hypothetical protein
MRGISDFGPLGIKQARAAKRILRVRSRRWHASAPIHDAAFDD